MKSVFSQRLIRLWRKQINVEDTSSIDCIILFYNLLKKPSVRQVKFEEKVLGASGKVETPDPIPNSAVKRFRANGSRKARVGQCRELFLQTAFTNIP